jgi:AcrR family transcriptional regulator
VQKRRTRRRPGRPPTSGPESANARTELLIAAAKVCAERGYRAASVEEIVSVAGLSKGTFYWHYDSKDALFLALLEERVAQPVRELMRVTETAPVDEPTAPVVGRGLAALLEHDRELILLLHEYWSAAVRDERLRTRYRERQESLRRALARALAERHKRTGVPLLVPAEALATAFIALAEGLSREALIDPDAVPEGLFAELLALVYDGLAYRSQHRPR